MCVLTGQICELSPGEKKHAVDFYNRVLLFQENSEILYKIGQIHDEVYGDNSTALEFYEKAINADPDHFRARYKISDAKERKNNWESALKEYLKIEYSLSRCENLISISEILYLHKVRMKILMICRKHISNQDVIHMYTEKLTNSADTLNATKGLDALFHCMFGKQDEEIKGMIIQEILYTC